MEISEEELMEYMEEDRMFRCEVCKEEREKKKLPPIEGLWLDINYHFVHHHAHLHPDMGEHISKLVGKNGS